MGLQRGEQSGSGTYTYANQAVYDGVWENGRKHGSGYFSSGNQLLLELWCRGVRVKRCEVRVFSVLCFLFGTIMGKMIRVVLG